MEETDVVLLEFVMCSVVVVPELKIVVPQSVLKNVCKFSHLCSLSSSVSVTSDIATLHKIRFSSCHYLILYTYSDIEYYIQLASKSLYFHIVFSFFCRTFCF